MAGNGYLTLVAAGLSLAISAGVASAHYCDADAIGRATPLLKLNFDADDSIPIGVDDTVKQLAPIKALKGDGKFDVLEVWGHIYKSDYRLRFIYAQLPDVCLLMGQEILETSDPY